MGIGIKFKIQDVRNGATVLKRDGERFKTDIQPKLAQLEMPWTAFPIAVPSLKTAYHQSEDALKEVTKEIGDALTLIGTALDRVATYYEAVEQRHAKELGIQ